MLYPFKPAPNHATAFGAVFFAATFFGAAFWGAAFFPFTAALTAASPLLKKFVRSPRGGALARMLLDWDTVGAIALQ